ncbi:hypothetical protein D9M68_586660 [compost metagenome]
MRGDRKQAGWLVTGLQFDQRAPGFQYFRQACNGVLAHLVAAGAAEQQGDQIALFDAQALGMAGQRVANHLFMQFAFTGDLVELMQFQPQPFRHRAIQLAGPYQWGAQAVGGALQGGAQ